MNKWVGRWAKQRYPDAARDLCTCFIERGVALADERGFVGMLTASSWMFISSFERFRKKLLASGSICSMIQQSTHGFPGVTVPTTMFVFAVSQMGIEGAYIRLEDFDRPQLQKAKALEALADPDCGWFFRRDASVFESIPGSPIAYWASSSILNTFSLGSSLREHAYGCNGLTTGENTRFLRLWHEVSVKAINFKLKEDDSLDDISAWVPYNKGGEYRKWASHFDYVINWMNGGADIKNYGHLVMRSKDYLLLPGFTWPKISSGHIAMRRMPEGFMFDVAGLSLFPNNPENGLVFEAFVNSSTASVFLSFLSPTLNFEVGNVTAMPILEAVLQNSEIRTLSQRCNTLAEESRDSRESSWKFKRHPLI